jgi:hypothetical protein
MAITDIVQSGKLFQDDGDPVEGATVQLLETGTSTVEATYSGGTTAAGLWSFTETSLDTTYDTKISSGNSKRYILWSDEIALKGVDTASLKVRGVEGAAAPIYLFADQADEDIDVWRINAADGGTLTFDSRASGSSDSDLVAHVTISPNATVANSTVAFAGSVTVATNLNPDSADGATIGSASAEWSDIYLADGAVINLGADQDVTLTHYADNGILLNSTRKIYFEDGSNYDQSIGSAGSGVTAIAAPTEIDLTAPTVDINASTAFTVDTAGISLDSSGASNLTTSGGALTITSAAAATWSTGAGVLTIDGDDGIVLNTTGSGNLQVNEAILVGADDAGFDVTFYGDTASRYWLWDTSADGVVQRGTLTVGVDDAGHDVKFFGDTASAYILWDTSADKLLTAGGAVIDIVKDKLLIGGTAVTTTAAELNLLDTASAGSVVNSKAVIYGSSGELAGTLSTAAQGSVTSLGTLTALTVDNVAINGATIGHTGDTDLITLASTIVTVAGEVSMTTLDIGGTNVTSTAAELNILDGVTSTAAELNILDGVTSTAAELNIVDGVTSTAAELNLVDGSSANSVVNSKAVIYGSSGELAGTLSTAAQTNITSVGTITSDIQLDANLDFVGAQSITTTSSTLTLNPATTLELGGTTVNGSGNFYTNTATGAGVLDEGASATNPTLVPNRAEVDTGIGWASDTIHIVLGGAQEYDFSTSSLDMKLNTLLKVGATYSAWTATELSIINNTSGGGDIVSQVRNSEAHPSANAVFKCFLGSADGGDPITLYQVSGGANWHVGLDNSEDDRWSVGPNSTPGTSDAIRISTGRNVEIVAGNLTMTAGDIFIGDTANGNMTTGLTINQGASDDEILAFKSSDVGHGFTDLAEADTYATFSKADATTGSLLIAGYSDGAVAATPGIILDGHMSNATTGETTSLTGAVQIRGWIPSSATRTAMSSDSTMLAVSAGATTRFLFQADGTAEADVEWSTYDGYDDLALVIDMEAELLSNEDDAQTSRREMLEGAGVIRKGSWHMEDGKPRAMVNTTRLSMLHHGALMQAADRIQSLESRLVALEGAK